jgi:hypothetical protein
MYSNVFKIILLITFILNSSLTFGAASEREDEPVDSEGPIETPLVYAEPLKMAKMLFSDIQRYMPEYEFSTLKSQNNNDFIVLTKPQTSGLPRGIAYIIPDVNQSILRQAATNAVYNELSNAGWHSMLLTMPYFDEYSAELSQVDSEPTEPSAAQETNSEAPESETAGVEELNDEQVETQNNALYNQLATDLPAQFSEKGQQPIRTPELYSDVVKAELTARIKSAITASADQPGFYLMICQGKSCVWLVESIVEGEVTRPDALIMLSAHFPEQKKNREFATTLAKTDFPTLDLYLSEDNHWVESVIEWRKKMSRRHFKTEYRQRKLFSSVNYQSQQQRVIKEIKGFLHAVGM